MKLELDADSGWEGPNKKSHNTLILESRNISKTSYFLNHKAYGPKTWQYGYLGWGIMTRKAKWHFYFMVTLQRRYIFTFTLPTVCEIG